MTLSVSIRFEVLKRDRFTCAYCGKHPPEVLLEVDHIVPRAAGGSDQLANLTTSCTECNRGKGSRLLEEGTAPAVNREAVAEMQERIVQAKAYMELLGGLESLADEQVWRVTEAWAKAFKADRVEKDDGTIEYRIESGAWPDDRSVRRFIKKLGLAAVLDAVDIAAARVWYAPDQAVRYFYGVCHSSIREGREPLSQQQTKPGEVDYDSFVAGQSHGIAAENKRLGDILRNWADNGFESLEDAILGLWPED